HELTFKLVREGRIQGLRIDHPDGLYDPTGYFGRLQKRCLQELVVRGLGRGDGDARAAAGKAAEAALREADGSAAPFYVVAEKILDRKEELPKAWSISGTVGYGALNALNGVFVDRSKETEFDKTYAGFIGHVIDYERLVYDKKKFFSLVNMASETATLAHRLDQISEFDWVWRDLTQNHLTLAIRETLACFPVYRTYVSPGEEPVSESDQRSIRAAVGKARGKLPALHPGVFDFLESVLLARPGTGLGAASARLYRDFTLRFQQLSGPIMAKGVEDTAFYVFNRLLSLNEVGGDPMRFGWSRADFHEHLRRRRTDWPAAMVETSTHDTKRSEDVRMRLNALSEIPLEWQARLAEWSELNGPHRTPISGTLEPRRNTEYFVYQTLLGAWPNEPLDEAGRAALLGRVWDAVLKSSREAKIYTNWSRPDAEYEEALRKFTAGIVSSEKFLASFLPFQEKVAFYGMLNSLSALALKLAAPGVPDTYQGNELWDYSLVDPDNRRRVDFDLRVRHQRSLVELEGAAGPTARMVGSLFDSWPDGRIKMHLLRSGLRLRRRERELFLSGEYLPLAVEGARQRNVTAFMRRWGTRRVLAAGGRFFTETLPGRTGATDAAAWQNTVVVLPDDPACAGPWRDVFTGETVVAVQDGARRVLEVPRLFGVLSAALLVNDAG
ncbi:MAG: malto-oligosyltrehalose synthase, partial [Elusimicrobia bacterium]|nr:malto-oligosyltrehalose synthase [Elusimicrobiota bacterium]